MREKLLNYTTGVSDSRTAMEIVQILQRHGATSVNVNFDSSGKADSLSFNINTKTGVSLPIRLPINSAAVLKVMEEQGIEPRYRNEYQANRTAWRIIKVWVEAQMALLETEMVAMDEIFLPYLLNSQGRTLYQIISGANFQLGEGRTSQ